MRMERQKIYKDKNGSYRIVLGTTRFGVTSAYLTPVKAYEGISGTKIDDIGYVTIDRILYISWDKFYDRGYTEYRALSDREYSAIVLAISQFMLGEICLGPDNVFLYRDELESLSAKSDTTDTIVAKTEETKTATVKNTTVIETTSDDQNHSVEIKFNTTTFDKHSNSAIIEEAKKYNIPIADAINQDDKSAIKYYDLFAVDSHPAQYNAPVQNTDHESKEKRSKSIVKHIFSEDETLAISAMNTAAVMSKYNVRSNVASLMIRNAKRIFGFEIKNIDSTRKFTSLFKMGYSPEEVSKMTGATENSVRNCFNAFNCAKNNENNASVEDKWNGIIKSGNIDLITKAVCDMTISDFCNREKCSIHVGTDVIHNLREFLNLNPLFCAGFGKTAFYKESLNELIDKIRNSTIKSDMATLFIYEKTMDLYDEYVRSFNNHADILAGVKAIPDSVPVKDRDYFITLIYNRFNPNNTASKNRVLNKMQKEVVENNASAAEFAMAFMISIKKASLIKTNYANYNKK